jgi:hypothetical protein
LVLGTDDDDDSLIAKKRVYPIKIVGIGAYTVKNGAILKHDNLISPSNRVPKYSFPMFVLFSKTMDYTRLCLKWFRTLFVVLWLVPSCISTSPLSPTALDEASLNHAIASNATMISIGSDISLDSNVTISDKNSLVIDGNGFRINGGDKVSCFFVKQSSSITFHNLTLTNGFGVKDAHIFYFYKQPNVMFFIIADLIF